MDYSDEQIEMLLTIEPDMAIQVQATAWDGFNLRKQLAEVAAWLVRVMDISLPMNVLRFLYHPCWTPEVSCEAKEGWM